jgi:Ca2+-binding EF-hand superfamily protein
MYPYSQQLRRDSYPYNSSWQRPAYAPAAYSYNAPGYHPAETSTDPLVDELNARLDALEQSRNFTTSQPAPVKQSAASAIDREQVKLLTQLFDLFEVYDIDGNGSIDKDEYWNVSNQLRIQVQDQEWTREMSDAQLEAMDINGDGVIEPSEFYAYCRKKLCANRATFERALSEHQDMTMSPEELGQQDVLASLSEQQKATMMIRAFQMFELYDQDGSGYIDKDEYWELSSRIRSGAGGDWTREMSDREVEQMDTNGDGIVSPEEFFTHCKKNLALSNESFEAAVDLYQDCTLSQEEMDKESGEAFWAQDK